MTKSPSAPATCFPCPPRLAERTGRLAAAAVLVGLLSVACGLLTGPHDLDNLTAARERWKRTGPADYSFEVRWSCECLPPAGRWIRVTVVAGNIVEGRYVDSGEIVEFRYWRDLPTVPALFDRVEEFLAQSPHRFDVVYHRDGYPLLLVVDVHPDHTDDEFALRSRNLQVLTDF